MPTTIITGPSVSTITGLSSEEVGVVSKALTYTNQSVSYQVRQASKGLRMATLRNDSKQMAYFQRNLLWLQKKLHVNLASVVGDKVFIPTGLLERVKDLVTIEVVDERRVVPKRTPGYLIQGQAPALRPYQQDQLDLCLARGQGTIESATGTGKTVVIEKLIQRLGLKALVIVPSISILDQTVRRFEAYFGKNRVSQYGDGKKKIKDITIACAPSVLRSKPADWSDRDVLIFDECHHLPCDTVGSICYDFVPAAYYRFGFTATPFRADGADLAIEAAAFPVIHRYTVQQGITDGWLATPTFQCVRVTESAAGFQSSHVKSFQAHVVNNAHLNRLAGEQAIESVEAGKQVLILVKERAQGHQLAARIPGAAFARAKEKPADGDAPWVDAWDAVQDFNAGKLRCLIGTSVIGEGTDLLPVDVLLMLAGGGSRGVVMQNLGRGLRKVKNRKDSVLVIDYFMDLPQAKPLLKHGEMRMELYSEIAPVAVIDK